MDERITPNSDLSNDMIFISSVSEYLREISLFEQQHVAQWYFRGHADCRFELKASLYRLDKDESFSTWDDLQDYLISRFMKEAAPFVAIPPKDEVEWLALAQHFGVPTMLLDWTTNPLVALYFSVEKFQDLDADVWCLGFASVNNCHPAATYVARWKHVADTIYFPRHISSRMSNQAGCFTIHESDTPLDLDPDPRMSELRQFARFRILAEQKAVILDELFSIGIHVGFIYPGLDGIGNRLRFEATVKNVRATRFNIPD